MRSNVQTGYRPSLFHKNAEEYEVTKNKDSGLLGCYTVERVSEHPPTIRWNLQPSNSNFLSPQRIL
jgi:hypothetical protein